MTGKSIDEYRHETTRWYQRHSIVTVVDENDERHNVCVCALTHEAQHGRIDGGRVRADIPFQTNACPIDRK